MDDMETRSLESVENASENSIAGYALKFNSLSSDLGGYREIISPNALKGVDLSDVRALINHDRNQCIGRTKAGTLNLEIDSVGLAFNCILPETTFARDLRENIKAGNISQCSFKFRVPENGVAWKRDKNGDYVRTIEKFSEIEEISIVTIPAYEDTSVAVATRELEKEKNYRKQLEIIKVELDLIELTT
ncbi:TPA: HK97 family phage prohead protease [Listeria monocytogenes]|uniref:HK97 family phage prohead protease n=1 Tax=Listeria TaxID=1637 RepID=UPI000696A00E|nr:MULTISPECIES: HK97 family phage prohead protease [Listeria]EAE4472178.1 HK97 family phage prohead protease [Listeria monocytogenes]EAG1886170.1 HK97 family phage prohead protease [Listeria monocytogenes]EAG8694430.1 HK97 family phage prohead protease [Listeria monocytogenes]EAW0608562.1 HK97 family phage prohead protease [Listeria monocytogenes]EEA8531633.1 HK97 family phage prohead protease [Listeria monocytogenes]